MDLLHRIAKDPRKVVPSLTHQQATMAVALSDDLYHNRGAPVLSDDVYDFLVDYHGLDTTKIGAPVGSSARDRFALPVYMGSLDKVRADPAAISEFQKRVANSVDISDKLDGISGLLVVDASDPQKRALYTRGDGRFGQDVSRHLSVIKGVPTKLPKGLVVRGELIISKTDYAKMPGRGANARNTVSGLISAKTSDVNRTGNITFVAYSKIDTATMMIPADSFEQLKKHGFQTPLIEAKKPAKDIDTTYLTNLLDVRRRDSPYEIDGIVVSSHERQSVETGRNPAKAIAYKHLLHLETASVKVEGVTWNVSKDGLLKPVVQFAEPVRLSGVSIERATGFNAAYIRDNKIGPGAIVVIKRAGDVIPHIMEVKRPSGKGAQMPSVPFEWVGTKDVKLANGIESGAESAAAKEHRFKEFWRFFEVLDVPGLGPAMARDMFNAGFDTVGSVLKLSERDFSREIPGFSTDAKRAIRDKLHEAASSASCVTLMVASNSFGQGFGARKLDMILRGLAERKVVNISHATVPQLEAIAGISTITARKFIEGSSKFDAFMEETGLLRRDAEKCMEQAAKTQSNAGSKGQVVFSGFRDSSLEAKLVERGYTISDTVNKKTVCVVAKDPDGTSSKLVKARSLGIKILDPSRSIGTLK